MTDGGPAGCKGTTILPLCIGSKTYYQHVLIAEIEAPFVLGYDILYDKQCYLDISKGHLLYPDKSIQYKLENEMPEIFKTVLGKTEEIPANRQAIRSGIFSGHVPYFLTTMNTLRTLLKKEYLYCL